MSTSEAFEDRPLPMDLGGPAPGTKCDLCAEVGIDKIATCERRVGRAWAYVCGAHRYRIDGRQ